MIFSEIHLTLEAATIVTRMGGDTAQQEGKQGSGRLAQALGESGRVKRDRGDGGTARNVGRIQVDNQIKSLERPEGIVLSELGRVLTKPERVAKEKTLLTEGAVYPRGCSEFVCAALGVNYKQANDLMGDDPPSVGRGPTYPDLEPGDIVGWINTTGSGHVAVYVAEGDNRVFIDVREPGAKPRAKERCVIVRDSRY